MNRRHLMISTALVLVFTGTVSAGEAKTLKLHCTQSGTWDDGLESNIDTNDDGVSATLNQGILTCNNGRFLVSEEVEPVQRDATVNCPTGFFEAFIDPTHGQALSVATDEQTGDQIFRKYTSETVCVDFSNGPPFPVTASGKFEYTGGTGKFAGASGTGVFKATGSILAFGFKNGNLGNFAQYTDTIDTTLTLPKDNH